MGNIRSRLFLGIKKHIKHLWRYTNAKSTTGPQRCGGKQWASQQHNTPLMLPAVVEGLTRTVIATQVRDNPDFSHLQFNGRLVLPNTDGVLMFSDEHLSWFQDTRILLTQSVCVKISNICILYTFESGLPTPAVAPFVTQQQECFLSGRNFLYEVGSLTLTLFFKLKAVNSVL